MSDTLIEWATKVWNCIRGCTIISKGCAKCYAMKQAHRFSGPGMPYEGLTELGPDGPRWTGKIRLVPEKLEEPLRWKKPERIFVNSMSDLFHDDVPEPYIRNVFDVMARTPQHTYIILTKRPQRMCKILKLWQRFGLTLGEGCGAVLPNVWLCISAEDQSSLLERAPWLLETPAAVRGISYEPALGPLDLHAIVALDGDGPAKDLSWIGSGSGIDWVIIGGESGPGARPFDVAWARDVVRQCKAAWVSCFVKQLGSKPVRVCHACSTPEFSGQCKMFGKDGHDHSGMLPVYLKSRKGGDMSEWPEELRVREFPA